MIVYDERKMELIALLICENHLIEQNIHIPKVREKHFKISQSIQDELINLDESTAI